MAALAGTFLVDDGFFITGRGLVLAGTLHGKIDVGYQIVFANGTCWRVTGISYIRRREQSELLGVLVDAAISSREELLKRMAIGALAELFAN